MWNQDVCARAYDFAAMAHGEQKMQGCGYPYIFHVSLVAMEIMNALTFEKTANPDLAVQCAFLHDVLEDTPTTYDDLLKSFGHPVADGVMALSKDALLPPDDRMPDSLKRIRLQPIEIWKVKLADRIVNLRTPQFDWGAEKKTEYRTEAVMIYNALSEASGYLAERLLQTINNYSTDLFCTQKKKKHDTVQLS